MWDETVGAQSCQEEGGGAGEREDDESKHVRALRGKTRGGGGGEATENSHISSQFSQIWIQ